MTRIDNAVATALAVFERESGTRGKPEEVTLTVFDNAEDFRLAGRPDEMTFEEHREIAARLSDEFAALGQPVRRKVLRPRPYLDWCEETGRADGPASRAEWSLRKPDSIGWAAIDLTTSDADEMAEERVRPPLTRDELTAAGEALYGPRWQSDLSRDLRLGDPVRIRQWLAGKRPIPAGIRMEVVALLRARADTARVLADMLSA